MAFADTAVRGIQAASMPVQVVLKAGQTVAKGDPLGYSSGWVQADGNPDIPAVMVAGDAGVGGQTINAFYAAVVSGFAGGTAGGAIYLSDVAGKYGSSAGTNGQLLGYMLDATRAFVSPSLPATAGSVTTAKIASAAVTGAKLHANQRRRLVVSQSFDIDAGAANHDVVLMRNALATTLVAGRIVYEGAESGACTEAKVRIGSAVNGEQYVAETALEASKAVGTATALTIVGTGAVAANGPVIMRINTLAGTVAGHVHVELEYTIDDPA